MKNVLTAITAFCLTFGLLEATKTPVEHIEMPEFYSQRLPRQIIEVPEFRMKMLTDKEREVEKELYVKHQFDDGDSDGVVLNDHEFY